MAFNANDRKILPSKEDKQRALGGKSPIQHMFDNFNRFVNSIETPSGNGEYAAQKDEKVTSVTPDMTRDPIREQASRPDSGGQSYAAQRDEKTNFLTREELRKMSRQPETVSRISTVSSSEDGPQIAERELDRKDIAIHTQPGARESTWGGESPMTPSEMFSQIMSTFEMPKQQPRKNFLGLTSDEWTDMKDSASESKDSRQNEVDAAQDVYDEMYGENGSNFKDYGEGKMDKESLDSALKNSKSYQDFIAGRSESGGSSGAEVPGFDKDTVSKRIEEQFTYTDPLDEMNARRNLYGLDPVSREDYESGNFEMDSRTDPMYVHPVVDDGAMTYKNATAPTMDGKTYKEHRKNGVPGRPIEEIEDDRIYYKAFEEDRYGYVPYNYSSGDEFNFFDLQDDIALGIDRIARIPASLAGMVSDMRPQNMNVEFDGRQINRDSMAKGIKDWEDVFIKAQENKDNFIEAGNEDEIGDRDNMPIKWNDIVVTDENGNKIPVGKNYEQVYDPDNPDGITMYYPDTDTTVMFRDEADYYASVSQDYDYVLDGSDDVDGYILMDGQDIDGEHYSPVQMYRMNMQDFKTDYGPFNIFKPRDEISPMFDEDNPFDLSKADFTDFAPYAVDAFLGSVPFFNPVTGGVYGASNAYMASQGLEPWSYDYKDGSARRLAENITDEQLKAAIGTNLLLPGTERLAGFAGKPIMKPFSHIINRSAAKNGVRAWHPAARFAEGTLGEMVEEPISDMAQQLGSSGPSGFYADPLLDANGNVMVDSAGMTILDSNTPIWKRARNFAETVPENALLGGTVGLMAGVPRVPGTVADTVDILRRNRGTTAAGENPIRTIRPIDIEFDMDEDMRKYYEE